MMKEHDLVVLSQDLTESGLAEGDVGTVVMVHGDGEGYEVEFATLLGDTVAVVTLLPHQIRPLGRQEIAHVRAIAG